MPQQYRKKPVVIEAIKFIGRETFTEIKAFGGKNIHCYEGSDYSDGSSLGLKCLIYTLEGEMTASQGDFIIKGINGEFYPCKSDIFEKLYEKV